MSSMAIRNLDDEENTRLHRGAAEDRRSMGGEARKILQDVASSGQANPRNRTEFTGECFVHPGGVELKIPPRDCSALVHLAGLAERSRFL